MPIIYRNLKGAPLSADELDQNFRELDQRLASVEQSPRLQQHGGIARISQEGPEVLFENTLGEVLGRLTLSSLSMTPQGQWEPQKDYAFYDLCLLEGNTYLCNTAHKSGDDFTDSARCWDVIFEGNS